MDAWRNSHKLLSDDNIMLPVGLLGAWKDQSNKS